MNTVLLLVCSNIFMTFAWYGHLKYGHAWPLWKAILVSWLIALVEYCFAVPANRWGFGHFSGFQLKIIQEAVTLVVFMVFAVIFLKERWLGTISLHSSALSWRWSLPLPSIDLARWPARLRPRRRPIVRRNEPALLRR